MDAQKPFGKGSVSLGLHPVDALPVEEQIQVLLAQARAAEAAGFDGVTFPEHHGGFPSYMPQPALSANWVLSQTSRLWSGPAPMLLAMRNPALVAEELSWSAARFPGRFGAVLAPGYAASDFEALGESFSERLSEFDRRLEALLDILAAKGPLAADPAIASYYRHDGTILLAANSFPRCRQAARLGAGLMFASSATPERLGQFRAAYEEAGGTATVQTVVRAWVGKAPETPETQQLLAAYKAAASGEKRNPPATRYDGASGEVADRAVERVGTVGANAVNVRLHVPGVEASQLIEQIGLFGEGVLPALREHLAGAPR